jgi:hypothetical protein
MSLQEKRNVVAKIITYKFGYSPMVAESIADDFIRDDFPKNNIRTMGEAVAFIDFVYAEARG